MPDEDTVKAKLRQLAASNDENSSAPAATPLASEHRQTIERARTALDDLDAAVRFVEDRGLAELERAVEAAEESVSACARDGRETLAAFRRFEDAASSDHFHSGRGTSLGDGDQAGNR